MEMKASVTGDGSNGEGSNASENIDDKASKYTGQPELQQQQFGWRRFKQWIHCFCVVTFDLELGQTIELVYPVDAKLSHSERSDLSYLAFPDSNCSNNFSSAPVLSNGTKMESKATTDSTHHFRIRRNSIEDDESAEKILQQLPANLRPDDHFFYGFAHFRRQRDPDLPRGYSQKSIVLLSRLPFVALFSRVINEVAFAYFTAGDTAIESACRQIGQNWPAPIAGGDRLLSLPLFGLRFCCSIPAAVCHPSEEAADFPVDDFSETAAPIFPRSQSSLEDEAEKRNLAEKEEEEEEKSATDEAEEFDIIDQLHCNAVLLESVHEPDQHFHVGVKRILPHLHILWEMILLGEPLVVLAPSPALSSSLVHSLISLIAPLRCQADYRPYFTIHDSDFNEICSRSHCQLNGCILGVTNPFFLKALAHWPHILKIGIPGHSNLRREHSESRLIKQLRAQPAAKFVLGTLRRNGTANNCLDDRKEEEEQEAEESEEPSKVIRRLSELAQLERRSGGFLCAHRPFLSQDKSLPRKLLRTASDSGSQWATLRWHFAELTQSFMSPLESYIATLMPLRRELSPFQPVLQMRPFSLEHFLASLKHFGHPGVKGDWQALYRQFMTRSPNFIGWLRQRQKDIERQLRLHHMDIICQAQFTAQGLAQRSQVEIVDLVLKLANRLSELEERQRQRSANSSPRRIGRMVPPSQLMNSSPSHKLRSADHQRLQLHAQLRRILASVDDDLRLVLLSNPAFRRAAEQDPEVDGQ